MAAPYETLSPSLGLRYNEQGQPIGKVLDDWKPCFRLPDAILTGRYCQVVPFTISHVAALHEAYSHDNSLWTYMPFGPFDSADELKATTLDRMMTGGFQTFVIMSLADKQPIGQSSYMRYDLANGSVEIGAVSFSPALKRSTIATEAMYLMMKHAFDHGYRRYEWKCDQLNIPSNKAALRLGFQFEGTFRNAVVNKGRRRDTCWYSVIIEDWPQVRLRLEAWLDPANFDANGMQKEALSASSI
jgi:RimJ/RimL family protein N-acetyltransferase